MFTFLPIQFLKLQRQDGKISFFFLFFCRLNHFSSKALLWLLCLLSRGGLKKKKNYNRNFAQFANVFFSSSIISLPNLSSRVKHMGVQQPLARRLACDVTRDMVCKGIDHSSADMTKQTLRKIQHNLKQERTDSSTFSLLTHTFGPAALDSVISFLCEKLDLVS